jgi:hypothetical protein
MKIEEIEIHTGAVDFAYEAVRRLEAKCEAPTNFSKAPSMGDVNQKLLAQHALRPSPGYMLSDRVLPEEHFEFQGGTPRSSSWNGPGSRATDSAAPNSHTWQ